MTCVTFTSLSDGLSSSLQQAQAVTLTVAQAFRVAFEFWQAAKEGTHGCPHPATSRWMSENILLTPLTLLFFTLTAYILHLSIISFCDVPEHHHTLVCEHTAEECQPTEVK